MIIIKCCIMFVAGISGNVHYSFDNFICFNPICEKKRNNILPIFFICFSKPLDLSLIRLKKKSKYKLRTKFKVKVKVQSQIPISNLMTDLESLCNGDFKKCCLLEN